MWWVLPVALRPVVRFQDGSPRLEHPLARRCRCPLRFGGLVFKAHRLVYHSTLGLRVMKKKKSLGFRVSGSRFRVPGCGFKVSGLGDWVQGFGFLFSGSRFRVLGFWFKVWGFSPRFEHPLRVRGTNLSTLARKRARGNQMCEPNQTYARGSKPEGE